MKAYPFARSIKLATLSLTAALCLTACGGGSDDEPDPAMRPGELLTAAPQTGFPALPDAAENYLITYVSTSFNGRNTVVSGQVAIPKGTPPAGGFPVISYGAGTNGPSDNCAPSNGGSSPAVNNYLNEWVKRGYAVLRTDYEGWGTPGGRPSGHGQSNANAIANIVVAAHALSSKLSPDWLVLGQSQGGGAAVWTAGLMQQAGGKYNLKGAIATAPTGPGIYQFVMDAANGVPVSRSAQAFISIVALAAELVDPTIELASLIADPMMPLVTAARTACDGALFGLPQLQPGQYYKPGPSFDAMVKFVRDQDPSSLTLKVPLFIAQAGNDQTTVTPPTTQAMVNSLCSRNASIFYKEYAGEGHGTVAMAAANDTYSFAAAALAGAAPNNACP